MHKEKWRWIKDGASLTGLCKLRRDGVSWSSETLTVWISDNLVRMVAYFFPFVVAQNGGLSFPGK